jgi:glycosyltransferase involved in cell wall biosynthesis
MAARVPILSTGVHGIRDLLTSGRDGWLIPPGDSQAISTGLQHLLGNAAPARVMAEQARARVVAEFDTAHLLPRHAALAGALAAGSPRP